MSLLSKLFDERFLVHRQRSSSIAGFVSVALAIVMFGYRYYIEHVWSWDLLVIIVVFVVIKLAMRLWYAFND